MTKLTIEISEEIATILKSLFEDEDMKISHFIEDALREQLLFITANKVKERNNFLLKEIEVAISQSIKDIRKTQGKDKKMPR